MRKDTTIITGFLGAGKTTFLNHLLLRKKSVRHAVIENEFGQENIDSKLIVNKQMPLMELTNGCICCTINDEFYDTLNELYALRDNFDELIIEATGVADPAAIAEPFLLHPAVKKEFLLKHVVCVIDAELIEEQLKKTDEAIKQIAFSNVLLINKVDLVNALYLEALIEKLTIINPLAQIQLFERNTIFELGDFNVFSSKKNLQKLTVPIKFSGLKKKTIHEKISSITVEIEDVINLDELRYQLLKFLVYQAQDVFRIKGVFYDNTNTPYIVQSVGCRVSIEPTENTNNDIFTSKFVVIGRNLIQESFEKLFSSCVLKVT